MTIEITLIISIAGVLIAFLSFMTNKTKVNKDTINKEKKEVEEDSKTMTTINMKLDVIAQNVSEIRLDSREMNKNISSLSDRVLIIENDMKNYDKRLEKIEEKK